MQLYEDRITGTFLSVSRVIYRGILKYTIFCDKNCLFTPVSSQVGATTKFIFTFSDITEISIFLCAGFNLYYILQNRHKVERSPNKIGGNANIS